jgi:hypothetical protein
LDIDFLLSSFFFSFHSSHPRPLDGFCAHRHPEDGIIYVENQIADELASASSVGFDDATTKQKSGTRDDAELNCIIMPSSSEKNSSPTYSNEVKTSEYSPLRARPAQHWKKAKIYCSPLALVGKAHFVIYSMSKSLTLEFALAPIGHCSAGLLGWEGFQATNK